MQIALYTILALFVLGVIAATIGWLHYRHAPEQEEDLVKKVLDMECCGQHEVCEKESLLAALSKQIEYYNDEELDRFRGRRLDAFSSDEIEEFREILYTMRSDEVAGWVRSLELRRVPLPDELKDEIYIILNNI